jgi:hypothetical protein
VLAAAVGLGMVACVLAFFVSPLLAVGGFVLLWVLTALAIVGYHVWNATSRDGVPHTVFGGEVKAPGQADQAARLRELEKLRADALVSDEEYQKKRADILNEDW